MYHLLNAPHTPSNKEPLQPLQASLTPLHGVKAVLRSQKKKKKKARHVVVYMADVLFMCHSTHPRNFSPFNYQPSPPTKGRQLISANKKRRETFSTTRKTLAIHRTEKPVPELYITTTTITTTTMDMDIDNTAPATTRTKPTSSATTTAPTVLTRLCDTQSESFYIYLTV